MSELPRICTSCGAVDSLEHEPASGTLACNRCGTVSNESSTASFEFLARVDEEDEFANGRMYVSDKSTAWGGGTAANGIRGLGGRASQWAAGVGERTSMFHAKKQKQADKNIRQLCHRFQAMSQVRHITHLFERMKKKVGFKWGYRAGVFVAACVYVGIREQDREIWIQDLMDCCESIKEPIHLARAIRLVKLEFEIRTKDVDPLLFVERTLVHLQKVFRSSPPVFHVGNKTKPFNQKNRNWIQGLSLEEVRTLAISLLRFSKELYLSHGRAPEQVACAVVIVALEGIARKPCPKQQEFDDEMAWMTNTAAFTIQERYREYSKALTSYAPKLPWVASKAKNWKKKEVVEHTKDIMQYWRAVDSKEQKERARKAAEEKLARAGTEKEEGEYDYDGNSDSEGGGGTPAYDTNTEQGPEEEEDPSELGGDLGFDDPLRTQTDVYAFSPVPESKPEVDRNARYSSNNEIAAKRPGIFVRGASEWTRHRAAQEAVTKGLGPSSASPSPFEQGSPAPSNSSGYRLYRSITPDLPSTSQGTANVATLVTYGQKPEATRAQLAPGTAAKIKTKRKDTRLSKLLWEKSVDEIQDEELFDDGELDSYLRTEEEANLVRRLPRYTEMVKAAIEQELKPKQPIRPRRRVRGQLNPEYLRLQQEAASKGVGMNSILKSRMKRERGEESDEEEVPVARGFRPRRKKTKVNAEAKAKLEALLAKGSDDEGDEQVSDEWVPAAIDAAERVESELVDVARDEVGDGEDYLQEEAEEGQDWRNQFFSYGEVLSDGYEDE
ncbi:hypothetical protein JCM3765_001653 [Sporobolomyces pararoseus]